PRPLGSRDLRGGDAGRKVVGQIAQRVDARLPGGIRRTRRREDLPLAAAGWIAGAAAGRELDGTVRAGVDFARARTRLARDPAEHAALHRPRWQRLPGDLRQQGLRPGPRRAVRALAHAPLRAGP